MILAYIINALSFFFHIASSTPEICNDLNEIKCNIDRIELPKEEFLLPSHPIIYYFNRNQNSHIKKLSDLNYLLHNFGIKIVLLLKSYIRHDLVVYDYYLGHVDVKLSSSNTFSYNKITKTLREYVLNMNNPGRMVMHFKMHSISL